MHSSRRVWLWVLGAVGVLILALGSIPFLFRGPIETRVKAKVGQSIDARVDWRRADVGILRSFPNLSLRLHDLTVVGVGAFESDTLLAVPRLRLVLDLGSVLRSLRGPAPVVVRSVELQQPSARLRVLEDGAANWDIIRERAAAAEPARPLDLSLRRLEITGGRISFDNRKAGLVASIDGLRHTLSGDFRQQNFTLQARSTAEAASLRFAGVPYLSDVRLDIAARVDADMAAKQFTLRDNEIRINDLLLASEGSVVAAADSLALDLAFRAPRAGFREILSLVPAVWARDFPALETSGTMSLAGWVRGGWGQHAFPAFALDAEVENGMFRYPDLPLPARDVFFDLSLANPGGDPDRTVVRLDRFHVVLGNDPVDGSLVMRTPVSDPDVDFRLVGRLDLANVPRTVKLEGVDELSGTVVANAGMRARLSDLDARRYDRVAAEGTLELRQMALRAADLRQPLRVDEAVLRLSPRYVELSTLRGRFGSSDVTMTGSLDNLLGFALRGEELRGQARVASTRFDLDEWRSGEGLRAIPVPGGIEFALDAVADTVSFGPLALGNVSGALRIRDRRVTLEDFRMDLLGGSMVVTGWYETLDPARPLFDVDLAVAGLDVPATFAGLRTVQAFAPVARWAEGRVSAGLHLNGALGMDMVPLFEVLSGIGSLTATGLVLRDFPPLDRLAELLRVPQLRSPGFADLTSSIEIRDGRLHVKPFDVHAGAFTMSVAGSNGIDQSLDYTLGLQLPRAILGAEANRAVSDILARTAPAGFDLQAADVITLGVRLTGTVSAPSLETRFRDAAGAAVADVGEAIREEAARRGEAVEERIDSAAAAADRRAREEAARIVAEAEQRAAEIRKEAAALAEKVRQEAYRQADSLEARPTNAVGRLAAKAAADRIRSEADIRAAAILREADARADALVAEARRRAGVPADTSGAVRGPDST